MRKKWTEEEDNVLRETYATTLAAELAERFNATISAVYCRAGTLGLKKDKAFISAIGRELSAKPDHGGRATRFKQGDSPSNKGKRQADFMTPEAIERTKKTRFKKGDVPVNRKPVGSERICSKNGYVLIKTAEPDVFELKHRVVWRQHHGSIPEGYILRFKDRNRRNCDISNLYLIDRKEHARENSIHRYPDDLKLAIKRLSKLKKLTDNGN